MSSVYAYSFTRTRIAELGPTVRSPRDVYEAILGAMLGHERESEALVVLALNTKNTVIGAEVVTMGSVGGASVRIAELFRFAVRVNATSIVLGHNHPSGDPTPSPEDLHLTGEAVAAGKLLDIPVLDHLIVGDGAFISLRDRGVGFPR